MARIAAFSSGRRVFEVACGTGYWTQQVAGAAALWLSHVDRARMAQFLEGVSLASGAGRGCSCSTSATRRSGPCP
ncbi:MAG: hypothetical protein E6K82_02950 [Candidatus Rokuibacteriota bacterium]|nr:MAG: hypothetical protein E6K82_02950 [Candidatus Rokubacteria bacterium]